MTDKATVDFIRDAKTGDTIWIYDVHANRYDENREYQGRGVWKLGTIDNENRASLFAYHGTKFDRVTGVQRATGGYAARYQIAGQKEYEAHIWMETHGYKLKRAVETVTDIDILKQIADLIGYKHD